MIAEDKGRKEGGSLVPMILVITASWLLILGETFFFFDVVRPLGPPLHEGAVPSDLLKIGLTAGLGVLWVLAMFVIWWLYLRAHRIPT